ncbi:hypothetical protein BKP64_06585 [Marinobacter salinus]|uniref:DUF7352 domain-containing protein n=1 Tax=Marinobacter salinus TaxID=1874317 RepID=A0A1D9GJW6_9GAMM|nr:hypothetical protein [Marinobacter salinus]AOY87861.1 hypothetical protein BKP64_06585 [Marinobacter salinus]
MKTIHKFRLESGKEPTSLSLSEGYRVVRCEYLVPDKAVFLWVEQSLSVGTPKVQRQFRVALTGEPVPSSYEYLDTALDPFGPEAYHVFGIPGSEASLESDFDREPAGNEMFSRVNWQHSAIS